MNEHRRTRGRWLSHVCSCGSAFEDHHALNAHIFENRPEPTIDDMFWELMGRIEHGRNTDL